VPLRHRNVIAGITNAAAGGYLGTQEEYYAYLPSAWVAISCSPSAPLS